MFKMIMTAAAAMTIATPVLASKARMASLQNGAQLVDTQSIFDNPSQSYLMGDFATLEMGATSTSAVGANTQENIVTNGNSGLATTFYGADAEGGFVKSYGDNKLGVYLGRKSAFTSRVRTLLGFAGQENPIEVLYGFQALDLKWGASVNYSKTDRKVAGGQGSQEAEGVRLGVIGSNWDAGLTAGIASKASGNSASGAGLTAANGASDYKGTMGARLEGGYWWDTTYIYGSYYMDGAEITQITGAGAFAGLTSGKIEQSQYEVGVIDTLKSDGMNFFYGVSFLGFVSKVSGENGSTAAITALDNSFAQEQTQMPFIIGVEADANSWMVLRASAKENVILGSNRVNGGDYNTTANNTTVALGAGMKFNKFMLDTTVAAGSVPAAQGTGTINANSLFTNASLTYMF